MSWTTAVIMDAGYLQKLRYFLYISFFMQRIISAAAQDNTTACVLNFDKYPYEQNGECIGAMGAVAKEWNAITTKHCCQDALATFSQAIALQANHSGYIFLTQAQWQECEFPDPPQDSISASFCDFKNLYRGSSVCSDLSLQNFRTDYREKYEQLLSTCSQFKQPSFTQTCPICTDGIEDMRSYLNGQLQLKNNATETEICGIAVIIAVAASQIENNTWVKDYFRCLPALDRDDPRYIKIKYSTLKIILGILATMVALVLAMVIAKYKIKQREKKKKQQLLQQHSKSLKGDEITTCSGLYRFSKAEIEDAINFHIRKVCLGRGSAGRVYKGMLPSGQMVAIKHIFKNNKSDRFTREVESMTRIRHPNLVCLFGCCDEDGDQYLVYEYCSHGNLAHQLRKSDSVLTWANRVKIVRDCALALRFLHSYPDGCIVHRDIKLTNILLAENMDPKLSDFELARMFGMQETKVYTEVKGTIGYMDPEYMTNGRLTTASDVFGFGIIILQILSGKQFVEMDIDARDNLTKKAKDVVVKKFALSDFADPRLGGQYNAEDFGSILQVAVLCVANSSIGRPTINIIFEEMDGIWKNTMANMPAGNGSATPESESREVISV